MKRTDIWLTDIRTEIEGIRNLTRGIAYSEFEQSWAMKRAAQHALLIIAEASKKLPQDLKEQAPNVPWQRIHGLGNLLRHEYRRIDASILWSVITEHLDTLDAAAEAMQD